jgi:acetylornithine deacetylase/succinyl-diaminopimelate desuccinylase-like protein
MKAPDGHVRYVSISTADKLSLPLKVTVRGTSTHSSMPRPDNAIFALSRALAKISTYETPLLFTAEQRQFIQTLAKTSRPPMSTYFGDLIGPNTAKANAADAIVSKDPLMHSLIRNTIAPTLINGGFRVNVIPGSAEATLNLRMIPGSDPAQLVETLKRLVADTAVTFSLNAPVYARTAPSPTTTDLYRALERSAKAVFPGVEVTPYLFQAGTDAGAWRSKGIPVYGIYPYPIDDDELSRMHGNDEKVSIASLKQGTEMIYRTLVEVAGKR